MISILTWGNDSSFEMCVNNIQNIMTMCGIGFDLNNYNIYIPSFHFIGRYTHLKKKENVIYNVICGCEYFGCKSVTYKILNTTYGERVLSFMPKTFMTDNEKDIEDLKSDFKNTNLYIMKTDDQRSKDLQISNNLSFILSYIKEKNCKSVQKYIKTKILNNKLFTIRAYMLITISPDNNITIYFYNDALILVSDPYTDGSNISQYITCDVSSDDMSVLSDLYKSEFLNEDHRVKMLEMMKLVMKPFESIMKRKNTLIGNLQYDIFGVDIIIDENDNPMFCEINVGPNMESDETDKQKSLHKNLFLDTLSIVGVNKIISDNFTKL